MSNQDHFDDEVDRDLEPYVEWKPKRSKQKHSSHIPLWREILRSPVIAAIIGLFGIGIVLEVTNIINIFPDQTSAPTVVSTITPSFTPTATSIPSDGACHQLDSIDGIPSGTTYTLTVEPNTFHIWTSGNVRVSPPGTFFPGGIDRGNVIVMLPQNNEATTYTLSDLTPENNWHGMYEDCTETQMQSKIDLATNGMRNNPVNCPHVSGCETVIVETFGE